MAPSQAHSSQTSRRSKCPVIVVKCDCRPGVGYIVALLLQLESTHSQNGSKKTQTVVDVCVVRVFLMCILNSYMPVVIIVWCWCLLWIPLWKQKIDAAFESKFVIVRNGFINHRIALHPILMYCIILGQNRLI